MNLQRAVVNQGVSLVEKNNISYVRVFRHAHLKNLSPIDLQLFTQPMALARLGRFLVDTHVERNEWVRSRAVPLLLFAHDESRGTVLASATSCNQSGVVHKRYVCVVLCCAVLCCAVLCCAVLCCVPL